MPRVLVLNGPNLDPRGNREPSLYGYKALKNSEAPCHRRGKHSGPMSDFRRSGCKDELAGRIEGTRATLDGTVAAALTNTVSMCCRRRGA